MRVFLTAFGLHNPYAGLHLQPHSLIPVATETTSGLDLDYSALLVAEGFIIDETVFEYVRDHRKDFLGPMFNSLEVLRNEGLLEIVDFAETLGKYRDQVIINTNNLLETLEPWVEIGRRHWLGVKAEFEDFGTRYSLPNNQLFDASHYGVISYLERRDGKIDPGEVVRLHKMLESKRKTLNTTEKKEMRRVLEPLVAQTVMNDLLRKSLEIPFLDWQDAQMFHDQLHLVEWSGFEDGATINRRVAEQSQLLFQTVIPELQPSRIEDVVKFVNNRKAVISLREELWHSLDNGQSVSKDWMLNLQKEASMADLRAAKRGRLIKWIGRAVGLVVPAGGTLVELSTDVVIGAAEEGAEHLSERPKRSRFEWYYVLQGMKLTS